MDLSLAPIDIQKKPYEHVVAQLRTQIAQGKVRPGDRLPSERELAEVFQVSRGTIREAFRLLELSGLIQRKQGATGGAFVIRGSSNAIVNGMRDLFFLGEISPAALVEARIAVGTSIVRIACERLDEEALAALEANVEAAEQAAAAGQFEVQGAIHRQFHVLLAKATGNILLIATMEGLMEVTQEYVRIIPPSDEHQNYTAKSRRRLLAHIRKRDAERAVAELTRQLKDIFQRYLDRVAAAEGQARAKARPQKK